MSKNRLISELRLVNGSCGDPVLFVDYPGKDDALLFDTGDNSALDMPRLADLEAVFTSHHHVDHFIGLDRIVRANIDSDKTLSLFGPQGTIRKVYDRIKSYEYMYFPFQKIVIEVHEILPRRMRRALLQCSRRFPEPQIEESEREGPVVFENAELHVEALLVDHTVPCLAYALVEKDGWHPDREKLESGALRPGPWIGEVVELLRRGAPQETRLEIQGGAFTLGALARSSFRRTRGARVAFVTDTAWSPELQPELVRLAKRARRLYCDSFYAHAQLAQATRYKHMTATGAAELARRARVEKLILMHFAGRYCGRYHALLDEARAVFPATTAEGI